MATRRELQKLACLRLKEAEALFAARCYDGCAYLCGYIVELALKAAVCARLDLDEYPEKRLEGKFKKHDFEDLKLLAGLERAFKTADPNFLANWSVASEWKGVGRYEPEGTYDQSAASEILEGARNYPHGVLAWLSLHW